MNDYHVVNHVSPLHTGKPLTVNIVDSSNVTCYGYDDGWALASAAGGTPPYTWRWDNVPPSTGPRATGLEAWWWYHVTVTDAVGNTATDSVMLSSPEPLVTGTLHGNTDVELYIPTFYYIDPPQDGYYFWTAIGGNIVGHPTGPHVFVRWTRPGIDTISVVFFNMDGCYGDTVFLAVTPMTVGTPLNGTEEIRIWPNPASGLVHISLPEIRPFSYRLTDLSGRTLKQGNSDGTTETSLPVDSLSPGIYILEIRIGKDLIRKKIMIR